MSYWSAKSSYLMVLLSFHPHADFTVRPATTQTASLSVIDYIQPFTGIGMRIMVPCRRWPNRAIISRPTIAD